MALDVWTISDANRATEMGCFPGSLAWMRSPQARTDTASTPPHTVQPGSPQAIQPQPQKQPSSTAPSSAPAVAPAAHREPSRRASFDASPSQVVLAIGGQRRASKVGFEADAGAAAKVVNAIADAATDAAVVPKKTEAEMSRSYATSDTIELSPELEEVRVP